MSDSIDPDDVAERLPERPVDHEEAQALLDALGWSGMTETYETAEGTVYVPRIYGYDPETRRAVTLQMDDSLSEWSGETTRDDVDRETWIRVNRAYAAEIGAEYELERIVSGEIERDLSDREDGR